MSGKVIYMQNGKTKNELLKLIVLPSSVCLFISFSHPAFWSIAFHFIIGCLLGFTAYKLTPPSYISEHRVLNLIAILLSIFASFFLCTNASSSFFYSRFPYSQLFETLRLLVSSPKFCVTIISYMLGIASVPFTVYIIYLLISYAFLLFNTINIKEIWKTFISGISSSSVAKACTYTIVNLIAAVFLGIILLYCAYSLPLNAIQANVAASAYTIQEEGTYPKLFTWATSRLDNFTDSIMLLEASDNASRPTMDRVMNVYRGEIDDLDAADSLIAHFIDDQPFSTVHDYTRYWHGYHIFLKPLLHITDYNGIRILNAAAQTLCVIFICILLYRDNLSAYIMPFIVSYLMLMPIAMAKSLQFSSCFYIMMFASAVILMRSTRGRTPSVSFLFFNTGILTSFFDFLTYPIATFGVPAVFCLLLQTDETLEQKLVSLFKAGVFWCIGFGGMWISKWIVASYTVGYDLLGDAFQHIGFRLNGTVNFASTSLIDVLASNLQSFLSTPVTLFAVIALTKNTLQIIKHSALSSEEIARILLPYAFIGLTPIVWFSFAKNHSAIHYWFTNKACIVTLLSFLFASVSISQADNKPAKPSKLNT